MMSPFCQHFLNCQPMFHKYTVGPSSRYCFMLTIYSDLHSTIPVLLINDSCLGMNPMLFRTLPNDFLPHGKFIFTLITQFFLLSASCCVSYIVLLHNHQRNKFVINNQCYCIIFPLLCTFATCFNPAGSSSGNFS
jgi:hypothetical protein